MKGNALSIKLIFMAASSVLILKLLLDEAIIVYHESNYFVMEVIKPSWRAMTITLGKQAILEIILL